MAVIHQNQRLPTQLLTAILSPLSSPIGVVPSCIATSPTTLVFGPGAIYTGNYRWDVHAVPISSESSTASSTKHFTIRTKRHLGILMTGVEIRDSDGIPILQGRPGFIARWKVNIPDGTKYKRTAASRLAKFWTFGINLTAENRVGDGKLVTMTIRQPSKPFFKAW